MKTSVGQTDKSNAAREAEQNDRHDVYQIVTDRIIELLESGVVPWHKPWAAGSSEPLNLVSKKPYRGVNVWLLSCVGYSAPYWVSYKQAQELGGTVRKGEKSSLVVFWKRLLAEDKETGEKKMIPLLRYYRVLNVEQCDGLEYPKPETVLPDFNPIDAAEKIASEMPNAPRLTFNEQQAYYSRQSDVVNMPKRETFDSAEGYYSTLFHELSHSTGHESRLGRLQNANSNFGSSAYAKEELIAEMGAAYLSAKAGIEVRTIDNSAAYIASWLKHLKDDRKLVVNAAAAAQKSSDYILGITFNPEPTV